MSFSASHTVQTDGRGATEVTRLIAESVALAKVTAGLCNVFLHHTSASLTICENADPTVLRDLGAFFDRLVPDGDPLYQHTAEGPDDMPAHVRSVLTCSSLSVPLENGRLALGTWQGIFVLEHRHAAHRRRLTVTVLS